MFVIDRFEGDFAVVEYGELVFKLPKKYCQKCQRRRSNQN